MPRSLRLPPELEAKIKQLAKRHDRSENAEIIVAVRQYVKQCADMEAMEHENALKGSKKMAQKLAQTLEQYLQSNDFRQGVITSTKASWGGSSYKVEISPDGTWRNLWANQIGNRYESNGVIIALPALDCDDMAEFTENGGTEDEYLDLGFDNERDVIEAELRDALKIRS